MVEETWKTAVDLFQNGSRRNRNNALSGNIEANTAQKSSTQILTAFSDGLQRRLTQRTGGAQGLASPQTLIQECESGIKTRSLLSRQAVLMRLVWEVTWRTCGPQPRCQQLCLYHTPDTSPLSTASECPCFGTLQHASTSTPEWSGLTAIWQWVLEPCSENLPSRATATLSGLDFPRERPAIKLLGSSSSLTFPLRGKWQDGTRNEPRASNMPILH